MSLTIERGRWGSIPPARIYINDGLAKALDLTVPLEVTLFIKTFVMQFQRSLEQKLGELGVFSTSF